MQEAVAGAKLVDALLSSGSSIQGRRNLCTSFRHDEIGLRIEEGTSHLSRNQDYYLRNTTRSSCGCWSPVFLTFEASATKGKTVCRRLRIRLLPFPSRSVDHAKGERRGGCTFGCGLVASRFRLIPLRCPYPLFIG